ncbi:MAG TPA: IclR family transcriptional regulator [Alphaproteobacteria bacterium]|nr:IclR family transcriptional regulator [Alphaproteobacteria bacterium]
MTTAERTRLSRRQPAPRAATRIPRLLCLLAGEPEGTTLSRLSATSGTPKSSLLALLRALTESGFVLHRDGRYAIGPEAVKLASSIVALRSFPDIAIPVVDALADATGESALLAELAPDGAAAVYIYKAESKSALRFIAEVGSREPLYASAVGRVLLAFQPKVFRDRYVAHTKLIPLTSRTTKSKAELRRIVDAVCRERRAVSFEETIEGVAGIAAPVFDRTGNLLAGLVIGAPVARAQPRVEALANEVANAADEISRLMGYSKNRPSSAS